MQSYESQKMYFYDKYIKDYEEYLTESNFKIYKYKGKQQLMIDAGTLTWQNVSDSNMWKWRRLIYKMFY